MRLVIFILFLIIFPSQGLGQKYLAFENMRQFRRVVFKPGDQISFRTHDSKAKYSGRIIAVDDSMITIVKVIKLENGGDGTNNAYKDQFPLKEISAIYYVGDKYWNFFRGMYSGAAMVGGVGLLAITGLNYVTDQNRTPVSRNSILTASGIAISGALLALFGGRNYKKLKKDKWRLRVIEAFDPLQESEVRSGK